MIIPIIINAVPIILLLLIFSLKIKILNIIINIYPNDSRIGPAFKGSVRYPKTARIVETKKSPYPIITWTLRYSFITDLCPLSALFFNNTWEIEAIRTEKINISNSPSY